MKLQFRKRRCNFQEARAGEILYVCHQRSTARGRFRLQTRRLSTSTREKFSMKIIGFEEHYGLPAIYEAAKKANDPYLEVLEALKKAGHFPDSDDPKVGYPPGIYDLGEGRIAAMEAAGIDVQILSYATPSAERLEPSLSRD